MTNKDAAQGAPESFGDTKAQTVSILERITANLDALDLTVGDVVKMQVYLAADSSGSMDFATEAQPNFPTRSAFQVAGLANPNWPVEIEVVAVRD